MPGRTLPGVAPPAGSPRSSRPSASSRAAGVGQAPPAFLAAATALVHGGARVVGIAEAAPRGRFSASSAGRASRSHTEVARALWRMPAWTDQPVRIEGEDGVERAVLARPTVTGVWWPERRGRSTSTWSSSATGFPRRSWPTLGMRAAYEVDRGGWFP